MATAKLPMRAPTNPVARVPGDFQRRSTLLKTIQMPETGGPEVHQLTEIADLTPAAGG